MGNFYKILSVILLVLGLFFACMSNMGMESGLKDGIIFILFALTSFVIGELWDRLRDLRKQVDELKSTKDSDKS